MTSLIASVRPTSVSGKVMGLVILLSAGIASVAGIGIYQMRAIGVELVSITDKDVPLTAAVSRITSHQLEQAILLEKILRLSGLESPEHSSELKKAEDILAGLSTKIAKEIKEGTELAEYALANATSDAETKEFTSVLHQLETIEAEYDAYIHHVREIVTLIDAGQLDEAALLVVGTEAEQEKLDHELIALLEELEAFTLYSAKLAKEHEQAALQQITVISVAAFLAGLIIALFVTSRAIRAPLAKVTAAIGELANGNTDVKLTIKSKDEIGDLAEAYEVFRTNTIEMRRLQDQAREEEEKMAEEKRLLTMRMATELENTVKASCDGIDDALVQLRDSANQLAAYAHQTKGQTGAVAAAAEEASTSVQSVASASEELAASILEISRQVTMANSSTAATSKEAKGSSTTVEALSGSAQQINDVLKLITDIAEQTNLLALNATIEAARAGDAGKGFAVVASEVKALATQTAKATEDISSQINAMQAGANQTSTAMESVVNSVSEVDAQITGIASAVEEQNAVTAEIARNTNEVAAGSQEIAQNIADVNAAAEASANQVDTVLAALTTLSEQSAHMKTELNEFLENIRAA